MEYQEQDNPTIIREGNKVMKTILNLIVYFKIDENLKDLFHFNEFEEGIRLNIIPTPGSL